jgi:hypothetical protein
MIGSPKLKACKEKLKAHVNSLEHLVLNSEYEVLLCNSYLSRKHRGELQATSSNLPSWGGGGFWMRRGEMS